RDARRGGHRSWRPPSCRRRFEAESRARGRPANRARARLLRWLRAGRPSQRPRQSPVRTVEPSPHRSGVQGIRARLAGGVLERSTARQDASQHEGTAVIALIDYHAGNLTSVRKALTAVGATIYTPQAPIDLDRAAG